MAQVTTIVGESKPGETAPRRRTAQKSAALVRPFDSHANVLTEYLEECVNKYGNRKCMGWRELVEVHTETKKVTKIIDGEETKVDKNWTYYEMSPYKYQTYSEVYTTIKEYAHGIAKIGLTPGADKLHIFASTSHKWMKTFLAAQHQNLTVVTAYDTLGEAGLTHSLVSTESRAVFTDNALLGALLKSLKKATNVKYIIHAESIDENDKRENGKLYKEAMEAKQKISEIRPDIEFFSYDDVLALGKGSANQPFENLPKAEDISCIMYTSGSTGDPKGVVLTQANILAGITGPSTNASRDLVKPTDRIIAFLPLAHIFEMVFELLAFWWGGCLGYANVKTLTDASCRNCNSDLAEFKPTVMVGVATVWENVRKGIIAKVKQLPYVVQKIFWASFKAKSSMQLLRIPGSSIFDIIFRKVKAATGGQLRIVLNGGSPVSRDTQEFITTLLCPMLIGYGLTETCANTTVLELNHFEYGVVGSLVGTITCKLVDVADAGYYAKNNQGEILLKGASITKEYWKNEKETTDAFTDDGWFQTGDIGEWTSNGQLKIIDRKKNLVKTANGEYIALEKLESTYRSNPLVMNICVYADQSKVKPIAMILPHEQHLRSLLLDENLCTEEDLKHKEINLFYEDPKVVAAVNKSLLATGKSQGLKGIELLQNVVLIDDEWTPQNGFVTSAQKLQRKKILEAYKNQVEKAYA